MPAKIEFKTVKYWETANRRTGNQETERSSGHVKRIAKMATWMSGSWYKRGPVLRRIDLNLKILKLIHEI